MHATLIASIELFLIFYSVSSDPSSFILHTYSYDDHAERYKYSYVRIRDRAKNIGGHGALLRSSVAMAVREEILRLRLGTRYMLINVYLDMKRQMRQIEPRADSDRS